MSLDFPGLGEYEPGKTYRLSVTVEEPGKVRFGFSMVARDTDSNTDDVGTWTAVGPNTQVLPGETHVGHQSAPREIEAGDNSYTFEVDWTAPSTGVGDVTFYVAGVAANGFAGNGGDSGYASTLTISEPSAGNLPPEIATSGNSLDVTSGIPTAIAGISVSDPDAGEENVTMTLSAGQGTVLVNDSVVGGVGSGGITNNGTSEVTMTGSLGQLNATLAASDGVTYQSLADYVGPETLEVTANDNGNSGAGGAMGDQASIPLVVFPPPSIDGKGFAQAGVFQFTLTGIPGRSYVVEYSETLQSWTLLEEVTLVEGSVLVTDADVAGASQRFYRAREVDP